MLNNGDPVAELIYVTCPATEVAQHLANGAVSQRLAACANILPQMTSVFHWDGEVQTENEVVLLLKTTQGKRAALTAYLETGHPYECACVVALPIAGGSDGFLNWVARQVGQESGP